jgi:hypothetical protein
VICAQVDANLALVGFDAQADFDAIVSADLFERLKPAPDIFLAAAREVMSIDVPCAVSCTMGCMNGEASLHQAFAGCCGGGQLANPFRSNLQKHYTLRLHS